MDARHFEDVIVTPEGTPLSGRVSVDVHDNGDYHVHVHMHSSSDFASFDYSVRAYLAAPGFPAMAFLHSGHVNAKGMSNHDEDGHSDLLAMYWSKLIAEPHYSISKDYSWGGVIGTLADLVNDIVEVFAGTVGATLGVVIGATKEAIGWMGATLGPGGTLGVIGGVVVFAIASAGGVGIGGALIAGALTAVAVCVIADELIDYRPLNDGEKALARRVFGDTVPLDEIVLTNLGAGAGRGFTAQGVDGKIYINLGDTYKNPLAPGHSTYPYPGQLLIHELTHAWQIANNQFLPGLMCSMLVTQADHSLGDDSYNYGPPGPDWSHDLNPEQQAAIVDQWYGGNGHSLGYEPMDQQNIYYRYVWDNVLRHVPSPSAPANLRTSSAGPLASTSRTSLDPPRYATSLPHSTQHVELVWAAGDGTLTRQWWSDDAAWGAHPPAAITGPGIAETGSALSVVARVPNHLDVFCIAPDAAVATQWWDDPGDDPATHPAFTIAAPAAARPESAVVAAARTPGHLDVFWVGADSAIMTNWWQNEPTGAWDTHAPFPITAAGVAQAGSGLAAITRLPHHIDVFWVGPDGAIWTMWWDGVAPNGAWIEHEPFAISPPGAARLGSPVTAVARIPDHVDVFWIAPDGAIVTQWWDQTPGMSWGDHPPYALAGPGSAQPASGLAVVARTQLHLDVFWVGPDASITTQWWDAAPGSSWPDHSAFPITAPGAAHSASPVSAVAHNPEHLDVFWVGPDGAVTVKTWDPGPSGGWGANPMAISPAGAIAHDFATATEAAGHLLAQSAEFANLGRVADAIEAARRAVSVLQRADVRPEEQLAYWLQLADALLGLVVRLAGGPPAQVAAPVHEAVLAYQQAAAYGGDVLTIAETLRTLSIWATNATASEAAVEPVRVAADLLRPLPPPAGREREYYNSFALVLFDVFGREITAGHPDQALAPAAETVVVYRSSAAAGADPMETANILLTLSLRTTEANFLDVAADATQAAVDILRGIDAPPDRLEEYLGLLALALHRLALRLIAIMDAGRASAPAHESVDVYRRLVEIDPAYAGLLAEAEDLAATLP